MKKLLFKIDGIDCASCVMDIDGALEDVAGVKEARTSYHKQQTEIHFDEATISSKQLTIILSKAGYNATLVD